MNPLLVLGFGVAALLAMGIPAVLMLRRAAAERHSLEARLQVLREAGQATLEPISRTARPRLGAGAPRALQVVLARADVTLEWRTILPVAGAIVAACVVVGMVFGPLIGSAALLSIVMLVVIGFRRLANRRLAAFVDGLPVFLDTTRQLLLVGNSFQQALVKAGANTPLPVQRYLRLLLRRVQNGAPVGDGLVWLADRLEVAELHMFAAAVQANMRHGGRLTNVLANLTQILRDRSRVERELKSSTAETRMSGLVLALMPVCVAGLITLLSPNYLRFFLDTASGHTLIGAAAFLELAGVTIMRRIMRLDF